MTVVRGRHLRVAAVVVSGLLVAAMGAAGSTGALAAPTPDGNSTDAHTGLKPGEIKYVWLIILENKSYDATFTGLNQNSYLWRPCPVRVSC
jgi:hypothetical protein